MLFSLGSNGSGQLGVGHENDLSEPHKVSHGDFSGVSIISGGGNHTMLVQDGALTCAGHLPTGPESIFFSTLSLEFCSAGAKVKFCISTWESVTIVTTDDKVYSCGVGQRGQLGLGPAIIGSHSFGKIPFFPPKGTSIIDISGGMSHVVVVLSTGEVYGWGTGRKGQLGTSPEIVWRPKKIEEITFPATVGRCGRNFTVIAGHEPRGHFVVLGDDRWGVISNIPRIIPNWTDVQVGWSSIALLCDNGTVVSWGKDNHGQVAPPRLPRLRQLAAGSEHYVALTEDGTVITWGWGEHGNCGKPTDDDGAVRDRWNVIEMPSGIEVVKVGAGCATSWIVCQDPEAGEKGD